MSDRTQYWSSHLERIAAEGITTKGYAKREGLSAAALYYWRSRLKTEAESAESPTAAMVSGRQWVPVQVTEQQACAACTLTLAADIHLELTVLPSPEWLARLVAAQSAPVR